MGDGRSAHVLCPKRQASHLATGSPSCWAAWHPTGDSGKPSGILALFSNGAFSVYEYQISLTWTQQLISNHSFQSRNKSLRISSLFASKNQRRHLEPSSEWSSHSTEEPGVHRDTCRSHPSCPTDWWCGLHTWISVSSPAKGENGRPMTECMECIVSLALLYTLVGTASFNSHQKPMKQVHRNQY